MTTASRRDRAQGRKARLEKEKAEKESKRRKRMIALGALVAVLAVVGVAAYLALSPGGTKGYSSTDSTDLQITDDEVLIPVSSINTNVKFSTVDVDGTAVRFFEVKGSDGAIHVAADACDVCYAEHRGYQQSGDSMKCNNCGKTFQINSIGTQNTAGGCWPSYLPISVEGDKVVIQKTAIAGKAYMFR